MGLNNRNRISRGYIVDEMHRYNILLEERVIFLHGYIENDDGDSGIEYRMANNFIKNIKLIEHINCDQPIIIHQHSVGGGYCEGMMMYDAISTCSAPIIFITHGIAASMGSIVPQAADLRVSMPHCWWLVHGGNTGIDTGLTYKQSVSWGEWEKTVYDQMLSIYCSACKDAEIFANKSDQQIRNFISKKFEKKEDWWLSAHEAVEHGFCDAVFGTDEYASLDELKEHVC